MLIVTKQHAACELSYRGVRVSNLGLQIEQYFQINSKNLQIETNILEYKYLCFNVYYRASKTWLQARGNSGSNGLTRVNLHVQVLGTETEKKKDQDKMAKQWNENLAFVVMEKCGFFNL